MVPCLRRDGVWIPAFAGMTAFAVINVAVYILCNGLLQCDTSNDGNPPLPPFIQGGMGGFGNYFLNKVSERGDLQKWILWERLSGY